MAITATFLHIFKNLLTKSWNRRVGDRTMETITRFTSDWYANRLLVFGKRWRNAVNALSVRRINGAAHGHRGVKTMPNRPVNSEHTSTPILNGSRCLIHEYRHRRRDRADSYNAMRYTRGGVRYVRQTTKTKRGSLPLGSTQRKKERECAKSGPVCRRIYGKSLSTSNSLNSLARSLVRQQRHRKTSLFSGNFSGIVTVNNVHLTFSFSLPRIVNPSSARSLFRS